jgi:hypothetical protein
MTRRTRIGLFGMLAALAGLATSGCVSSPQVESATYPAAWPALSGSSICGRQSLRFRNGAVASTFASSASPPASERIQLSDMLLDGGHLKHADHEIVPTDIVELNFDAMTAFRINAGSKRRIPVPSTAQWRCAESVSMELTFPAYSGGGESTLSSTVNAIITLTLMEGGDLAVRDYGVAKSVLFPGVSQTREGADWIRFRRAD